VFKAGGLDMIGVNLGFDSITTCANEIFVHTLLVIASHKYVWSFFILAKYDSIFSRLQDTFILTKSLYY